MRKIAICYSGAPSKTDRYQLGTPHYSYRFAEGKFLKCLSEMGLDTHFVAMPEYYSTDLSYEDLPIYQNHHVHLIFRSTEEIRILKRGYNIACYAWEFPFIKTSTKYNEHPFLNQKRMLALCDEIWVPCEHTKRVLDASGLKNVHVIPAPIATSIQSKQSRLQCIAQLGHINTRSFRANFLGRDPTGRDDFAVPLYAAFVGSEVTSSRRVYLSIFNPEDFRKNLDALIRGFDIFQQISETNDLLIIKALTSVDRFSLEQVVTNVMLNKLEPGSAITNQNILVFSDYLTSEQMTSLYDLADFYVCTSIAEGQNLPLQEAMARGVVPVTTCNTAMLDYIDRENAVIISTVTKPNRSEHLAGNIAGKPYEIEICSARQVADAFASSTRLNSASYSEMSDRAKNAILSRYSIEVIKKAISRQLVGSSVGCLGSSHENFN